MLTQEALKKILNYDESTGVFTWKVTRCGRAICGDKAGETTSRGYIRIRTSGGSFFAHRLAWLYVYGSTPSCAIDHIDGNTANNRIYNLRADPHRMNSQNQRNPQRSNKSGYLGVCWHKKSKKWIAQIRINKATRYIGTFDSPLVAHIAYVEAKRRNHEFNTL